MNNIASSPLKIERSTRSKTRFKNRITSLGQVIDFTLQGRAGHLHLHAQDIPQQTPSALTISMLMDGHPLRLDLSTRCLQERLQSWLSMENFTDLPQELRLAMIESVLDEELVLLERVSAASLKITGFDEQVEIDEYSVGFSLIWKGNPLAGYLSFSEALWPLFAKLPAPKTLAKTAAAWEALAASVRFEVGYSRLPAPTLRDLAPGDIVFLDRCPLTQENALAIRIVPNLLLKGSLKQNTIVVEDKLEDIMLPETEPGLIDIDELAIDLVFEIGETKRPLRDLKTLRPGYIFELNTSLENPVTVRANGQAIGNGELLEVDGRIGVRITGLRGKNHG